MSVLGAISPFLDLASKLTSIKKTETILSVSRKTGQVTPLLVGEDLALRSSIVSPAGYDRELIKILQEHTEIVEDDSNVKYDYLKFCNSFSNIDKTSLVWALYKSTYEILAKDRKIKCPKETCKQEFKIDIELDELIHDDTYKIWDEVDSEGNPIPFNEFRFPIHITDGDVVYSFNTKLPSIADNNMLLGLVSIDVLQKNLDRIGAVFSKPQQMALVIDAMQISSRSKAFETVSSSTPQEILMALENYVTSLIAEKFIKAYGEKFDSFTPKFYKKVTCTTCKHTFDLEVDLEVEFFRRSILGREES